MIRINRPDNFIPHNGHLADALAARSYLASMMRGKLDGEERASLDHHRIHLDNRSVYIELPRNAMSGLDGARGGFIAPAEGFVSSWVAAYTAANSVYRLARKIPCTHGGRWHLPSIDYTSLAGEKLGENVAATAVVPTFGDSIFDVQDYISEIKVPNSLRTDAPDFDVQLAAALATIIGQKENTLFTTGDGSNTQPQGVVTGATTVTAAGTTAITVSDLARLVAAANDSAKDPSVGTFMLSPSVYAILLGYQSGGGDVLFTFGSSKLLGYNWAINAAMDSTIASGKKTALFGDFSRYCVAEVPGVQLMAATETLAEFNQTLFHSTHRADGRIVQPANSPFSILVH